ncbi:NADPH-dependent FMN reductase [Ferruginibacter albus]|uniref:NADPH-dependent FMN reductase n=1 Tax=Ferruginibacter albus TaxID=2875540 RepID=UPI001CC551CA|nr:NAD(P)H-dependent oxidoreductase [Ferruginibacter albus]UAY52816.1 NAD(P)H-dependent oxidoreductase [Ferruginibacter albus]
MYTIISGTNRADSHTLRMAKKYREIFQQKGIHAGLLSLEGMNLLKRDAAFEKIEKEIIIPTTDFIILSPEYNGSFPGVLKLLFDTSESHKIWWNKRALLTGISSGRAGNLRGMDHLTGVLNYLKITVHPNKLPISQIYKICDGEGNLTDEETIHAIHQQIDEYIEWSKKM